MFTCETIYQGCASTGRVGCSVYLCEEILKSRGIYKGELDKQFGPQLAEAVAYFQRVSGLEVDKIVGPATWHKLVAL